MFEQHIAEIVWRNHVHKENLYEVSSCTLNRSSLSRPPQYTYPKPLFDTWTPPSQQDEQEHHITIVQESETDSDSPSEAENEEHVETLVQSGGSVSANANDPNTSDELSDHSIPLSASTLASTPASIQTLIPHARYASTPASIPTSNQPVRSLNDSPQPSMSNTCEVKDRFVTKRKMKAASTENTAIGK